MDLSKLHQYTHPLGKGRIINYIPSPSESFSADGSFEEGDWFYCGYLETFQLSMFSDVLLKIEIQFSLDCKSISHSITKRSTSIWRSEKVAVLMPYLRFVVSVDHVCGGVNNELVLSAFSPAMLAEQKKKTVQTSSSSEKHPGTCTRISPTAYSLPPPLRPPPSTNLEADTVTVSEIENAETEGTPRFEHPVGRHFPAESEMECSADQITITPEEPASGGVSGCGGIKGIFRKLRDRSPRTGVESRSESTGLGAGIKRRFSKSTRPSSIGLPSPRSEDIKGETNATSIGLPNPRLYKNSILISDGWKWKPLPKGLDGEVLTMIKGEVCWGTPK